MATAVLGKKLLPNPFSYLRKTCLPGGRPTPDRGQKKSLALTKHPATAYWLGGDGEVGGGGGGRRDCACVCVCVCVCTSVRA